MSDNRVRFTIEADARTASRVFNQLASDSKKTGEQIKHDADSNAAHFDRMRHSAGLLRESVGGLAGAVGFGGLAFGLKDAIQGGMQLQAAQAQLRTALGGSRQEFERLSAAAERASTHGGFTTPENVRTLTSFVRETHSAAKAQQLFTLSTNIARGANMDLGSAQSIVAAAYGGRARGLQKLLGPLVASKDAEYHLTQAHKAQIIQLEAESKWMGKLGPQWLQRQELLNGITPKMAALAQLQDKSATAQQVISAAERVFGGATAAYAGKTQGKVSDLNHAFDNLKDTVGLRILPTVNKLLPGLTFMANEIGKIPVPVLAAVTGLTLFGSVLGLVGRSFRSLASPFQFLGRMLFGTAEASERAAAKETGAAAATERLAAAADGAAAALGRLAEIGALGGGFRGGLGGGAAAAEGKGAGVFAKMLGKVPGGSRLLGLAGKLGLKGLAKFAGEAFIPATIAATLINHVPFLKGLRHTPVLGSVANILGFAGGGTTPYSGSFLVGERGPELVNLPGGSQVVPNSQMGPQVLYAHITVKMPNGRILLDEVVREALNRAARGPTSFVGGSLVTGARGFPA